MPNHETYLGDGLYVSFDGWQLTLRAPRAAGDHYVCLEPVVWEALLEYVETLRLAALANKPAADSEAQPE